LAEEIPAAVAGQAELGQDDQLDAFLGGLFEGLADQLGVRRGVAQPQGRGGRRDGHKTVLVNAVGHLKAW